VLDLSDFLVITTRKMVSTDELNVLLIKTSVYYKNI